MKEFKKNRADLTLKKANHIQIRKIILKTESKIMKQNLDMKRFLKI